MIHTLVLVVEEPSKRHFLEPFLQHWSLPPTLVVRFVVANGHSDLTKRLHTLVRSWRTPYTRFLVLCDQDSADCVDRKGELVAQIPPSRRGDVVVRIVCTELEGWYLTDPAALDASLPGFSHRVDLRRQPLGSPDSIARPAERIARSMSFRKRNLAQAMGARMSRDQSSSPSLNLFIRTLDQIAAEAQPFID